MRSLPAAPSAHHEGGMHASTSRRTVAPATGKHCRTALSSRKVPSRLCPRTAALPEVTSALASVQPAADLSVLSGLLHDGAQTLAAALPEALQPAVLTIGGDLADVTALSPTLPGLARLLALYYFLLTKPNPFWGIMDFYLLGPLSDQTSNKWSAADFVIRDRLGGGNFGVTYEGLKLAPGDAVTQRSVLSPEQKKRRVVLKRVNLDKSGVRQDFLKTGTMAKGAAETGQVEAYMCSKVKRNPIASKSCAQYLGYFNVENSDGAFTKGTQWLVWKFESDSTLGDALDGNLGPFPACMSDIVLGKSGATMAEDKRDALIIKSILKKVLVGLQRLHSIGIVHRDIKPENLLVTVEGDVKIIDFGASVDMCTGINFNPLYGMLDPRYSPPEELVMPQSFPRAPLPFLAAVLSPFAWVYGRPDLFDSYTAGVLLVQMSVPQLRSQINMRLFNAELKQYDYNLATWRQFRGSKYDYTLLDRNNRAGWDLACKLISRRNDYNRGRLSVSQALAHRFFLPEF